MEKKELTLTVTPEGIALNFENLTYVEALGMVEYAKMWLRDSALVSGKAQLQNADMSSEFSGIIFPLVDGPKSGN